MYPDFSLVKYLENDSKSPEHLFKFGASLKADITVQVVSLFKCINNLTWNVIMVSRFKHSLLSVQHWNHHKISHSVWWEWCWWMFASFNVWWIFFSTKTVQCLSCVYVFAETRCSRNELSTVNRNGNAKSAIWESKHETWLETSIYSSTLKPNQTKIKMLRLLHFWCPRIKCNVTFVAFIPSLKTKILVLCMANIIWCRPMGWRINFEMTTTKSWYTFFMSFIYGYSSRKMI